MMFLTAVLCVQISLLGLVQSDDPTGGLSLEVSFKSEVSSVQCYALFIVMGKRGRRARDGQAGNEGKESSQGKKEKKGIKEGHKRHGSERSAVTPTS
jgi:hypothetical protein